MKRRIAGAILTAISAPLVAWIIGFFISSYQTQAEVSNLKQDVQEIKEDTRFIKNYLLEHK